MTDRRWLLALACWPALAACGAPEPAVETATSPIIHDTDDRRDYFQLTDEAVRDRMSTSIVALVNQQLIRDTPAGPRIQAQSWADAAGLCPGQPFGDQPAAAFCSGVLVDRDLVLTSAHCLRLHPLDEIRVVFGYYQPAPGQLATGRGDVVAVQEITSELLGEASDRPRVDHAFIRLAGPVGPPRSPSPIAPEVLASQPVIAIGAGGGIPLKADAGGTITDLGLPWLDYFSASTDTFGGFSGGGLFDRDLRLLGILVRGAADYEAAGPGCLVATRAEASSPGEQFTYAAAAVAHLCARKQPPAALCAGPDAAPPGGCSYSGRGNASSIAWLALAVIVVTGGLRGPARLARVGRCCARWSGVSR